MRLIRRRPLLRAVAVGGGAYYTGKRRMEAQQREAGERARIAKLVARQAAASEPQPSHRRENESS